jgi:hypothetical protein
MSVGSLNIITDGLVFYVDAGNDKSYPGSGINCYDITSNNNSGVLTNGPTFDPSNVGSIVFDGVNDSVIFADSPSISITGDMTINCWIRVSDTGGFRGIIDKSNVSNTVPAPFTFFIQGGYSVLLRGDGIDGYPIHYDYSLSTNSISVDVWENVTITYSSGTVTHYLNSEFNGTSYMTTLIGDMGYDMYIGNRPDNGIPMIGNISCVQLYNRALTPDEVLHNYNKLKFRFL